MKLVVTGPSERNAHSVRAKGNYSSNRLGLGLELELCVTMISETDEASNENIIVWGG